MFLLSSAIVLSIGLICYTAYKCLELYLDFVVWLHEVECCGNCAPEDKAQDIGVE
jgi:hypothetical protein